MYEIQVIIHTVGETDHKLGSLFLCKNYSVYYTWYTRYTVPWIHLWFTKSIFNP